MRGVPVILRSFTGGNVSCVSLHSLFLPHTSCIFDVEMSPFLFSLLQENLVRSFCVLCIGLAYSFGDDPFCHASSREFLLSWFPSVVSNGLGSTPMSKLTNRLTTFRLLSMPLLPFPCGVTIRS